jgi:ABC-2 type transport system permease protein
LAAEAATIPRSRGLLAGIRVVLARETGAYFDSSIAYVYASVFLLLAHGIFMNGFFLESVVDMAPYFRTLPFLLTLFIPAITMRGWAEERASGTFELVMTLPLRPIAIVLGKYFAALLFYLAVLAGSLPIVIMLFALGRPDGGLLAASYLGAMLLGALLLAIGLFLSALTREQIVAFVAGVFVCAILVLSGHEKVVEVLDGLKPEWQVGTWLARTISVLPRYESFCRGVVSFAGTFYFVVTTAFFLVMNEIALRLARH